jgi:GTPase
MPTRFGTIGIYGLPNAGKSTLINSLVGQKITITSRKPQTTQQNILGIVTTGESQIAFIDTPGLPPKKHRSRSQINKNMKAHIFQSLEEADVVLYAIDLTRGFQEDDSQLLKALNQALNSAQTLNILALKSDKLRKSKIALVVRDIQEQVALTLQTEEKLIPLTTLSAKNPGDVNSLQVQLAKTVPLGDWKYGSDDLTDMPQRFMVSEFIREQLFRQLGNEIPYQARVQIDRYVDQTPEQPAKIWATIIADTPSQKSIIIGHRGNKIKDIRVASQKSLLAHMGKMPHLMMSVSN